MIYKLFIFLLCLSSAAFASHSSPPPVSEEGEKVYNKVSPSFHLMLAIDDKTQQNNAHGIALAIGKHQLLSSCHVALAGDILIVGVNDKSTGVKISHVDKEKNLCISTLDPQIKPLVIGPSKTINKGTKVYVIGVEGRSKMISEGIVTDKKTENGVELLQIKSDFPFELNAAGIFDNTGKLIGIVTTDNSKGHSNLTAMTTESLPALVNT